MIPQLYLYKEIGVAGSITGVTPNLCPFEYFQGVGYLSFFKGVKESIEDRGGFWCDLCLLPT